MFRFDQLSEREQTLFMSFPAYLSLLAVNSELYSVEESHSATIQTDFIKSFQCCSTLKSFYAKAADRFELRIEEIDNELPEGKFERDVAIKLELRKIKEMLRQFDPVYARIMHRSMREFKEHVSLKCDYALEDFLFPLPIKCITD